MAYLITGAVYSLVVTPWGEFQDADVADVNPGALALEAKVSLFLSRLTQSIHKLPVHGEFHHAVDADHVVVVPLSAMRFGPQRMLIAQRMERVENFMVTCLELLGRSSCS